MINDNKMLYNEFDEFDESLMLPETASEELLSSYSKGNCPAKINAFNKLLNRVQNGINKTLMNFNTSISGLKIKNTFSSGAKNRSVITKFAFAKSDGSKSDIEMNLNVNINKFLKYPALEVYSLISSLAYAKIFSGLKKEQIEKSKLSTNEFEQAMLMTSADITKSDSEKSQYEDSKFFLTIYLKEFLPSYFGFSEINNIDYIAELVADQLLGQMSEWEIAQVSKSFFKFDKLNIKAAREGKKYIQNGNAIFPYRTAKLQEKATQFALNSDEDFSNKKALGAQQQYLALSGTFAGNNAEVKDALAGGFSNDNEKLKNFCRAYAESFMRSNGLTNIEVNFVNSGNCEYFDKGNSHCININLSAPELAGGNVTELVMTLSHELTHAVDSSINKINGNFNEYGGGLINTMSEDLSECDVPEAKKLLQRVQAFCYQLNPNERHGRIGEISALKFLSEIYAGDEEMREQMQESINKYSAYQRQTISCAEGLSAEIENFKAQLSGISSNSKAYKMIEKRIAYLEEINQSIDVSAEKNSVVEAYQTIAQRSAESGKVDQNLQNITEYMEKE